MDDKRAVMSRYLVIPAFSTVIPDLYPVIPAKAGIQKAADIAGRARERDAPAR